MFNIHWILVLFNIHGILVLFWFKRDLKNIQTYFCNGYSIFFYAFLAQLHTVRKNAPLCSIFCLFVIMSPFVRVLYMNCVRVWFTVCGKFWEKKFFSINFFFWFNFFGKFFLFNFLLRKYFSEHYFFFENSFWYLIFVWAKKISVEFVVFRNFLQLIFFLRLNEFFFAENCFKAVFF